MSLQATATCSKLQPRLANLKVHANVSCVDVDVSWFCEQGHDLTELLVIQAVGVSKISCRGELLAVDKQIVHKKFTPATEFTYTYSLP